MSTDFLEIPGYVRDVGIVNKHAVICIDNQEPQILGIVEKVIFDSQEYLVTFICWSSNGKRIVSFGINHKLFKKLQLIVNMSELLQSHTKDVNI